MVIFSPQEKRLTVAEAAMVWLVSCRIVHPNACKPAFTAPRRSTDGSDPTEKCKVCSAGNPNAIITTSLSLLGHSISGDSASTLECKKSYQADHLNQAVGNEMVCLCIGLWGRWKWNSIRCIIQFFLCHRLELLILRCIDHFQVLIRIV